MYPLAFLDRVHSVGRRLPLPEWLMHSKGISSFFSSAPLQAKPPPEQLWPAEGWEKYK